MRAKIYSNVVLIYIEEFRGAAPGQEYHRLCRYSAGIGTQYHTHSMYDTYPSGSYVQNQEAVSIILIPSYKRNVVSSENVEYLSR
jgi:hypothetical protein